MTPVFIICWAACGLLAAFIRNRVVNDPLTIGEAIFALVMACFGPIAFVPLILAFIALNLNRPLFGAPKNPTDAERDAWVYDDR